MSAPMRPPVVTFFNNKGGVGKTSLVYHLSWMLSELGIDVLVVDLDPQANLTAAFFDDDVLEELWEAGDRGRGKTIYRCVEPLTDIMQQHGVRLSRPVQAYDRWIKQIPAEYSARVLGEAPSADTRDPGAEDHAIATVKHYRSLVPLAQEARKPIFALAPADGAIGSHATAARDAFGDFQALANEIVRRVEAARGRALTVP